MVHQHTQSAPPASGNGKSGERDASDQRRLLIAFWLIAGFMLVEVLGGLYSNSLTLLADAGHMLLDASALGLSWYALRLSQKQNDSEHSYGYHRFQILAAFVNGLTLLALSLWIFIEAIGRLKVAPQVLPIPLLIVAATGLVVNLLAFSLLHQGAAHNLNLRAAALHVLGDILGSVAAIAASLIIYFSGWTYADPLLAFLVVAVLMRGAFKVVLESGHILLEGVPRGIDLNTLKETLVKDVEGVDEVHHIHVWALTPELPMITLHALIAPGYDDSVAIRDLKRVIQDKFQIPHSTIQIEREPCNEGH